MMQGHPNAGRARRATLAVLIAALSTAAGAAAAAPKFTTLYAFAGGSDGAAPQAPVIAGPGGVLYGTTSAGGDGPCSNALDVPGCGVVFALNPPRHGQTAWTETILYAFADYADGSSPVAGLLSDNQGNLFGTTLVGGSGTGPDCGVIGCGTVFELSPPTKGKTAWTKTILYSFQDGSDGAQPAARLIMDSSGALLGTTSLGGPNANCSCGTVFRLTPPVGGSGAWTEAALYAFKGGTDGANPETALLAGPNNSYFGTTLQGGTDPVDCEGAGCGTVFELRPGHTGWSEHLLHSFVRAKDGAFPLGDLIADAAGHLYGTVSLGGGAPFNGGTVFALSPPSGGKGKWTESVLHAFGFGQDGDVPDGGVVLAPNGTLYGTTVQSGVENSGGTIFSLAPPKGPGKWKEQVLYDFPDNKPGAEPMATLLLGNNGALFGTTLGFSVAPSLGTVFSITP